VKQANEHIKGFEMGGTCGMNSGYEERIQKFSRKNLREEKI